MNCIASMLLAAVTRQHCPQAPASTANKHPDLLATYQLVGPLPSCHCLHLRQQQPQLRRLQVLVHCPGHFPTGFSHPST